MLSWILIEIYSGWRFAEMEISTLRTSPIMIRGV